MKLYGRLQPGANRHWTNSLPALNSLPATDASGCRLIFGKQWQAEHVKIKKAALSGRPMLLILRAGHGIRTRDFDLGKVALYH